MGRVDSSTFQVEWSDLIGSYQAKLSRILRGKRLLICIDFIMLFDNHGPNLKVGTVRAYLDSNTPNALQ